MSQLEALILTILIWLSNADVDILTALCIDQVEQGALERTE